MPMLLGWLRHVLGFISGTPGDQGRVGHKPAATIGQQQSMHASGGSGAAARNKSSAGSHNSGLPGRPLYSHYICHVNCDLGPGPREAVVRAGTGVRAPLPPISWSPPLPELRTIPGRAGSGQSQGGHPQSPSEAEQLQHRKPARRRRRQLRWRVPCRRRGRDRQRRRETETRAAAVAASDGEIAAHQLGQIFDDGEPEA